MLEGSVTRKIPARMGRAIHDGKLGRAHLGRILVVVKKRPAKSQPTRRLLPGLWLTVCHRGSERPVRPT